MNDKIIVSNNAALLHKYGKAGVKKIEKAVKSLIVADAKRGIKSRLVYLDKPAQMKSFRGKAVTDRRSARQNKEAIDAIFQSADPEYLMILGAPDVVPHQDMTNPVPPDDPDERVDSDLPYACDTPYSRNIATFSGPTRVVGRLPDLTGADELRICSPCSAWRKNTDHAMPRSTANASAYRPIPGASPHN